jgi:iron complex outermembrane receptor protein
MTANQDATSAVSRFVSRPVRAVALAALALASSPGLAPAAPSETTEQAPTTGSHIRGDTDSAYPITIYNRDMIEASGANTLQQFIQTLPQNFNGGASETTIVSVTGGGNAVNVVNGTGVNLRGVGNDSTLVLVNGHRVASGNTTGNFVDLSLIPLNAVERIEVITDGASAIYGADAVGGVVNIILGRNLEGAETRVRYGAADGSSSHETKVGQTLAHGWDTGSALLMYEYLDRTPLSASDRSNSSSAALPFMLLPEQVRHGTYFSIEDTPAPGLQLFAEGMYSRRSTYEDVTAPGFSERTNATIDAYSGSVGARVDLPRGSQLELSAAYSANETRHGAFAAGGLSPVTSERTRSDLLSIDAKWDGTAYSLPSGDVRFAVGAQFRQEGYDISDLLGMTEFNPRRQVTAGFVELRVPLVAPASTLSGSNRLELTLADRDELYSEFGSSNNPQIGLIYRPLAEVKLRGTYGTAFRAPLLSDLNPVPTQVVPYPEFDPRTGGVTNAMVVFGGNPDLKPEKARTWTLGLDFTSRSTPEVHASVTYYNIRFSNLIEDPEFRVDITDALSQEALLGPTIVQRNPSSALLQQLAASPNYTNPFAIDLASIGAIVDSRVHNLSIVHTSGLDLDGSWETQVPLGSVELGINATYIFGFDDQFTSSAPTLSILNTVYNPVNLRVRGRAVLRYGGVTFASFVNYTNSYTDNTQDNSLGTLRAVASWTTLDMTLSYLFSASEGPLANASVGIVATNIAARNPPVVLNTSYAINFDGANANARGRVLSLRLSKRW